MVSLRLSCHDASSDMQYDLHWSSGQVTWPDKMLDFQIDLLWSKCICLDASRARNTMVYCVSFTFLS